MACSGRALADALGATHCTQHSHAGGRGGRADAETGCGAVPCARVHCAALRHRSPVGASHASAAAELRMALDAVTKDKKVKRGVKEVVKAIRKKQKGCAAATIVAVLV